MIFYVSDAQINETFNDGDFSSNPSWNLNSNSDFSVTAGQLKSTNTTSNTSFYISTTNTLSTNCVWEFWINLQFATSAANYVDAYLVSNTSNLLSSSINGYFVRIGNTNDDISLYKCSSGTSILLIDGLNSSVSSSSNNLITIKVTRTSGNLFTLERDVTGTGNNYVSEGSVLDNTYTASTHFGFIIKQSTASFFSKHFFDDISIRTIVLDTIPPTIVNVNAITSTQLDVEFNELVEINSAQTLTNYLVNNAIGNPISAVRDVSNPALVHLTFNSSFVNTSSYSLTISGVKDASFNSVNSALHLFTYMAPISISYKDIVINEIFADPIPVINLTTTEFIELYNRSNNTLSLNGLKLSDNYFGTGATLGNYTMTPGSYLIVCSITDTAQFTALGYTNKLGVSSFPSLNNSGDNLYLKTNSGTLIDSVNYSDSWYQDAIKKNGGYTLEQINPNLNSSCSQISNWKASTNANGGTPGFINSIYSLTPDIISPKIISITVLDSLHINICFDDVIATSQLTVASNYSINGGIGAPILTTAGINNMCVLLTLQNKLINATNYTITISGISDCNSNTLSPNTTIFSYYKAQPYDVVINEIMVDPDPSINLPNEEYVELKNRTNYYINLKNWNFSNTISSKKLPDVTIAPNSFIVLVGTGASNQFLNNFNIITHEVSNFPSLLNNAGTITLSDSNYVVISSISYSSDWYHDVNKNSGGWSLEQIDSNNPCGESNNWHASSNANGGTPASENSVSAINQDVVAPKIKRILVNHSDTITVIFTESINQTTLLNPLTYNFDHGLSSPTYIKPIGDDFKKVILKLASPIQLGIIYHLSINSNITDCVGNLLVTELVPFALPSAPAPNDIVVNEIMFDSYTNCIDFIELYNKSNNTIDLKNLRIGSMDTLNNVLTDTRVITNEGYLLFPKDYLVISENNLEIKNCYFTNNPDAFLDVNDLPTMNADADVVTLSDDNFTVIDNFKYNSQMHFPLLINTKGVSLERIDFNRPTNDKTNWNSASQSVGFATPAYLNSQYLKANDGNGIAISNPMFSPDNDGYNDVLNITYKINESGISANIFIYDDKGREVKHLIKNEQLATEGTISWNGINDDNQKASIGIYIVYVELFNLSGKVNTFKLSCTLAGKL